MPKALYVSRLGVLFPKPKSEVFNEFHLYDKVFEILNTLGDKGYLIIVVSNTGYLHPFSKEYEFERRFIDMIKNGVVYPLVFANCEHELEDKCDCKFPNSELFSAKGIDNENSIAIIASKDEATAAKNAKIKNIYATRKLRRDWKNMNFVESVEGIEEAFEDVRNKDGNQ